MNGKRVCAAVLLLLVLLPFGRALAAPEEDEKQTGGTDAGIEEGVSAWMDALDTEAWGELLALLPEEAQQLWSGTNLLGQIEAYAMGRDLPNAEDGFSALRSALLDGAKRQFPLLLLLVGIALLSAFAQTLSASQDTAKTAAFVCRCFALTAALAALAGRTRTCMEAMTSLVKFMELALPALFTLLTAMGSVATVGIFQPATALLCGSVAACMRTVVLPLAVIAGVLSMMDRLSERDVLGGLAGTLKRTEKWIIGAVTTIYIGVMTVSGIGSSGLDGLTVRTAKYAASSMVTVVGGMVSGSFDTVLGCASLVKNALGTASILLSASIVLVPVAETAVLALLFRLSSGLSGAVADKRLTGIYDGAADALQYVVASLVAVMLMFMVTVGLLMALTNYVTGGG